MIALGIDAGGTKAAWCARTAAGVVQSGQVGAIQAAATEPAEVAAAIAAIVSEVELRLGERVSHLVAGLAGAGNLGVRATLRGALAQRLGGEVRCAVIGDVEVAAAACLADASGVAIWSGTGSFAVARATDGMLHRAGGRGLLLDDRGGAASIVIAAARHVVEAADGLRALPAWASRLTTELGAPRPIELGRAMRNLSPGDLARLLFVIGDAASEGDGAAREILAKEMDALAERALAAVSRAGLMPGSCPIWCGGGALSHVVILLDSLGEALTRRGFQCVPRTAPAAVGGALALALAMAETKRPLCDWLEDEHAA